MLLPYSDLEIPVPSQGITDLRTLREKRQDIDIGNRSNRILKAKSWILGEERKIGRSRKA